jgi:phage repressor protein C with HTH and peptisase S24 domain
MKGINKFVKDGNRRYVDILPLYSLKAAAGKFGEGQDVEEEGWLYVGEGMKLHEGMFVAQVVGKSMEPTIPDGSFCIFRRYEGGTCDGKVVLAQQRDIADPETGGSCTVKRHRSTKVEDGDGSWSNQNKRFEPDNPAYEAIEILQREAEYFKLIAEYIGIIGKRKDHKGQH